MSHGGCLRGFGYDGTGGYSSLCGDAAVAPEKYSCSLIIA